MRTERGGRGRIADGADRPTRRRFLRTAGALLSCGVVELAAASPAPQPPPRRSAPRAAAGEAPPLAPPRGRAQLVRVPSRLDNLLRTNVNSHSNLWTVPGPRGRAVQYFAFYDERRRTHIARREFPNGEFGAPVDIHDRVSARELEYDSHNNAAVGVASDGTVFVLANHHVDPLQMARTTRAHDITSFERMARESLGARDGDRVTYPAFFYLGNDLCLSYREQEAGRTFSRFRWLLKRYDAAAGRWSDLAQLNTGNYLRLYVSNIGWSADRSTIHLAACWRDDRAERYSSGTSAQFDLFHLWSRDARRWYQYGSEREVPLPLDWRDPGDSDVPVNIWTSRPGGSADQPANSGTVEVDGAGRPHILHDSRTARRGSDSWLHVGSADGDRFLSRPAIREYGTDDLFRLPDGGMAIIGSERDGVWCTPLDGPSRGRRILLAEGFTNEAYVVCVDKTAMEHGWLSMMLTHVKRGHWQTSERGAWPQDAWVMSIPGAELAAFDSPFRATG